MIYNYLTTDFSHAAIDSHSEADYNRCFAAVKTIVKTSVQHSKHPFVVLIF